MCQCNPSIKTPFCGKGECVPPKQNVEQFVPWGKSTPTAIIQQAEARRREAEEAGEPFVLAVAWARKRENGNWVYSTCWTTGPGEVLFYMAHHLQDKLKP